MRARPSLLLLHGGPGGYDHSYFKPYFSHLTDVAQVVYLDLRGHGRSQRDDPAEWSYELCADDVRAFCDTLGISRPVVLGHSMGGFVAIHYGARHRAHAGGLVLLGTKARFDLERLVEGFRRAGGDEVAELARREYSGVDPVTAEEWARVYAAFGPNVPDADELARRIGNLEIGARGAELLASYNATAELGRIRSPTLVCVGELDAVTPVEASREIMEKLPQGIGRLEVLEDAGHFPWKDTPDRLWSVLREFIGAIPAD